MENTEKRVLLFIKIPPPITGATLVNKQILECNKINDSFKLKSISISYKDSIEDTSAFSFYKIWTIASTHYKLFKNLLYFKPHFIYFQISPLGLAFYRDCTYVLIMKLFHTHILYHMHGKGIKEYVENSKFKNAIYKWAFINSSIICLSESLKYDIDNVFSGLPYIVNNGIPNIISTENLISSKNNIPSILFLSNLIISKGILVFLDAIEILKNKNIDFKATIVGKEADINKTELIEEIQKRQIDSYVKYLGPKYNEEKNEIFRNSDILIYPTYNDVWGLVILEAMQFGLPVIASREGAIPEMVDDGVTGYLVDKHRPDQIAEKIEILINNPDLRKSMGAVGRKKFLEKYTLDIFESKMYNVFKSVFEKTNNY